MRRIVFPAAALLLSAALPAPAWDSKGHNVVEALAYRTLVEGHGDQPPRPDVLRDLVNDGSLAAPFCFGRAEKALPKDCVEAARANPLLCWPQPRTDRPDAAFRRQFSDPGQCFHFMATLDDAQTESLEGSTVPRGLATTAVVRCRDLLDDLLRQVVIDGGPGTRQSGYGLYEMAHAVADSFSGAHTERRPADKEVDYLRVWQPIEKLARLPTDRARRIPPDSYHTWNDRRDRIYVDDRVVGGERCEERTDHPYDVPYECLSVDGDLSRQAVVELLVLVRDLRAAQVSAPPAEPAPERSETWKRYKEKWFTPVHPCRGAECDARQPVEKVAGGDGLVGVSTQFVPKYSSFEVSARGELLRASEALNPFVYGVAAEVGYGKASGTEGFGFAGLQFNLYLPVGKRAIVGFSPMLFRATFGGEESGSQVLTRFLQVGVRVGERTWLSLFGPFQVDWARMRAEWALGAGLSIATGSAKVAGGPLIRHHHEKAERHDEAWVPPAAPYGRLKGRKPSLYVTSGMTPIESPEGSVEGRRYGLGTFGGEVAWDRDRWGGRFAWVSALSLSVGARATSGEVTYLTGIVSAALRWYALGPLGLSLTPVRVEGGPKAAGRTENDPSPDVHGSGRGQYYLQAGTRLGIALNAGIVDLLVEGPTLAWRSDPFNAGEVVSIRLGIRIN